MRHRLLLVTLLSVGFTAPSRGTLFSVDSPTYGAGALTFDASSALVMA